MNSPFEGFDIKRKINSIDLVKGMYEIRVKHRE